MKKITLLLLAAMVAAFTVIPAASAAVIGHDQVVGFAEVTPATVTQQAAKRFQPYLKVYHGCVPFPAVDAAGNTSGGLQTSGASNGQCSQSTGQVYSRSAWYNGVWAIMYAWYFPKDSPSPGLGHRHDWEGIESRRSRTEGPVHRIFGPRPIHQRCTKQHQHERQQPPDHV
ncbi:hypothetical protein PAECIP111890_05304 [Paenibacillus sp. JJ-223]|nr:hypothetical protein PAECIP111890_05304 [Paenibacillus sp. JJ-223]